MDNLHKDWQQGRFIDQPQYRNWTPEAKQKADAAEKLLVRPYPTRDAICRCSSPEEAKWIAGRLNLASILEQMTYDFTTGKIASAQIRDFVVKHVSMNYATWPKED